MICTKCGANINDNAKFCTGCGTQTGHANAVAPDAPSYGAEPAVPEYVVPEVLPNSEAPRYGTPHYDAPQYNAPQYEEAPQYGAAPQYRGAPQYGETPQHGGATPPYGGSAPRYGHAPMPPVPGGAVPPTRGNKKLLKIFIPIGAVVVVAVTVGALLLTGILDLGRWINLPEPTSTLNTGRDDDNDGVTTTIPTREPSASESPAPESPSPDSPAPVDENVIPGSGGTVRVSKATVYTFTPDQTGMWVMRTSDDDDGADPTLSVCDSSGKLMADDDDSGGGADSLLKLVLEAGQTYTVTAGMFQDTKGSYTLTVECLPETAETSISGGGGTVRVSGNTEITFTPDSSGIWEMRTSDNDECDPLLIICDENFEYIDSDDDGGDGYNAQIVIYLEAGDTYIISAEDSWDKTQFSYTLTVQLFDNEIPADGGTVFVSGATRYMFTPDRSGDWEFRTSDNGVFDPFLKIDDTYGNYVAEDDDGGGEYNALIQVSLNAGDTYIITAGGYADHDFEYMLTVSYLS